MYICSILVVFGHYWSFSVVQTPFLRVLTFDPQANDLLTRWVKVGHQSTRTWTTWMRIPLSGIMTMTYYDCEYHSYIYIIIYIIYYIYWRYWNAKCVFTLTRYIYYVIIYVYNIVFVCLSLQFIILTTRYTCWLRWEGTPIRPSMCSPVLRGNDRQSCTDQYVFFSGKVPFGKLTFCFGKSQFSMGKSIVNHHVQ